jgi:Fic family protein
MVGLDKGSDTGAIDPEAGEEGQGAEVTATWNGAPISAWVPAPLGGRGFALAPRAIRLTERAAAAVLAAGNRSAHFGPVATLLLRTEGVASSYIEGIRAPLAEVAAAEVGAAMSDVSRYVADNLGTVVGALGAPGRALRERDLHEWHRRLTESSGVLPGNLVGAYRTEQSWVGGTSPRDAAYVPPPAEFVGALMRDLVDFANRDDLDPVTQAAVLHAQFESIHPYGDGNGRIGRVLIGWVLSHRLGIMVPPPVSTLIARDPGGYLAGLTLFRLGQLDAWVEWVAAALERSSAAADALLTSTEALVEQWRIALHGVRTDATAHRVVDLLVEQPVVSAPIVAERLGTSARGALTALITLEQLGIVEPYVPDRAGRGRPTRFWVARSLIELVAAPGVA